MSDFLKRYAEIVGEKHVEGLRQQGTLIAQIVQGRHKKQMSQQALADAIGISKSTIARIESGQVIPRANTLERISKALETPLIIGLTEEKVNEFQKV